MLMESDGNVYGIFFLNSNVMGMCVLNLFLIGCIYIFGIGQELYVYVYVVCIVMEVYLEEYY